MDELKYKIREDLTKNVDGHNVYRIEALKDFSDVKKGDLGGWIEKEDNLSQKGNCWAYDDAIVFENARIYHNTRIFGNAEVYGKAVLVDDCTIYDNAIIRGYTFLCFKEEICGDAVINQISDFIVSKDIWSNEGDYTYTRSNRMWKLGSFYGTGQELIDKAYKDSELSGRNYTATVKYVEEFYKLMETE